MGEWLKLAAYRERLMAAIERRLGDFHGDGIEGSMEILTPGVFNRDWSIELHCCVFGDVDHHTFEGPTLSDAVDRANEALDAWVAELAESEAA